MEKLILTIISNENLWRYVKKQKVFERAVHLRNRENDPKLEGKKLDREREMFN
jgi:hypothetical protein